MNSVYWGVPKMPACPAIDMGDEATWGEDWPPELYREGMRVSIDLMGWDWCAGRVGGWHIWKVIEGKRKIFPASGWKPYEDLNCWHEIFEKMVAIPGMCDRYLSNLANAVHAKTSNDDKNKWRLHSASPEARWKALIKTIKDGIL